MKRVKHWREKINKKEYPKCNRYGKTKYNSEEQAHRAMIWIWGHDPHAKLDDLHTYQCEFCNSWHIGHRSKYKGEKNGQTGDRSEVTGMETTARES